jgi:signal transduction histidine kinase
MLAARFSEQLNDEGKLYIEKINNAAGNMRELIENLLQISRTVQHAQPFVAY